MPDLTDRLRRWVSESKLTRARLDRLEQEIQEQRQLSRRVAELTDIVTELLIPLAQNDPETARVLARYRSALQGGDGKSQEPERKAE